MKKMAIRTSICIGIMIFFFFISPVCSAQQDKSIKVNYKNIEQFVKKDGEQFKQLVNRFVEGDTTLTLNEIAIIYYGSFYSTKYSYMDASNEVREKMKNKDYAGALELCKQELQKSPASLDLLQKTTTCSHYVGESKDIYLQRISQILSVILASGDGKTEETAYKVVAVSDEYFIIYAVINANLKKQALVGHCDKMTIYTDDAPDETVDIYFDVTLHLSQLNSIFGDFDKHADKPSKKSKKK